MSRTLAALSPLAALFAIVRRLQGISRAQRCWRGVNEGLYSAEPCP